MGLDVEKAEVALKSLIDTVDVTGGVRRIADFEVAPVASIPDGSDSNAGEGWSDLGSAYLEACDALGVEPKYELDSDWVDHLYHWQMSGSDNFAAKLFELIAKADPDNKRRLSLAYPEAYEVYMAWWGSSSGNRFFAGHGYAVEGRQ